MWSFGAIPLAALFVASSTLAQSISDFNPFEGHVFYVGPVYRPQVLAAVETIRKSGDIELANKAAKVANVSTFLWLDSIDSTYQLETWLKDALAIQRSTRKQQIVQLEVYNLPDRDCSAKASAGELTVQNGGEEKYKREFIDRIVRTLKNYPDVTVALGLETDAIGNLVGGQGVPKCANARTAQLNSLAYAVAAFQLENVAIYLDGAHAAWLGWPGNIESEAKILGGIVKEAQKVNPKAKVRGVATNVSNYNGLGNQNQTGYDELVYIKNLAPLLAAEGIDAHFIVDQGRSGRQDYERNGGDWCNNAQAGFGPRPTANTPDPLVDAIVWVKPGGEGDGTSDPSSPRFDESCISATSKTPAPEAGTWFQAYFEQLVRNASPSF